jgi:hypothetical protein
MMQGIPHKLKADSQLIKILTAKDHYRVHKSPSWDPLLGKLNAVDILAHLFSKIQFNPYYPYMRVDLPSISL